jgi:RNA polymerase sigma-70 factor (ECF subfamily)
MVAAIARSAIMALLIALDGLEPVERLAYVLHHLLAAPYDDVALAIGRSPAEARRLADRARQRVQHGAGRGGLGAHRGRAIEAFLAAARAGDDPDRGDDAELGARVGPGEEPDPDDTADPDDDLTGDLDLTGYRGLTGDLDPTGDLNLADNLDLAGDLNLTGDLTDDLELTDDLSGLLDPAVVLRADPAAVAAGSPLEPDGAGDHGGLAERVRQARPALIDGVPGAVWPDGGPPRLAFLFAVEGARIVGIELVADPARLAGMRFEPLDEPPA